MPAPTKRHAKAVASIVDALDLPDGASLAMIEEILGLDSGDAVDYLVDDEDE